MNNLIIYYTFIRKKQLFLFSLFLISCSTIYSLDLQNVFDKANVNEIITIPDGNYKGNFVINKPLTVIGNKNTILEGEECVLLIKSDNVTVKNMTFFCKNFGIKLDHARFCIIKENVITGKNENTVSRKGNGIHILYGDSNLIENNTITDVRDGIYFDYTKNNKVNNNKVINSRYGYHIMYSENNILISNSTRNSIIGSMIMTSSGSVLENNNFSGERNVRGSGIFMYQSNNCIIENNIIKNNTVGFSIDMIAGTIIKKNLISGNAVGIKKVGKVTNIHFTENNIAGNVTQIGGRAVWDESAWSYKNKGNYWDDYRGFDFNGDKIGDGAYRINNDISSLFEKERFLGIFFGSPLCLLFENINLTDTGYDAYPLLNPSKTGR
jgi:nitrous oxidase accessory protein